MSQIRDRLGEDHEEIRALLQHLAEDAEAPNSAELEASWDTLEVRLLRHMEAEERYLLPLLEASHAVEAERIRVEHARIRGTIARLGIAIELHAARKSDLSRLIELLNAHSAYEDAALYELAGDKASVAVGHSITATLKGLRSAVRQRAQILRS
jgi:Hemerythrin HHE cation binding domain